MQTALRRHGVRHDDGGRKEIDAPSGDDPTDEALDRRRLAKAFRERLAQRFGGDENAAIVVALFLEGAHSPAAQARASGLTGTQIRDARRRVFRHAKAVSAELGMELDADDAREDEAEERGDEESEVCQ
jgi:hypothetical protein